MKRTKTLMPMTREERIANFREMQQTAWTIALIVGLIALFTWFL